MRGFMNETGSEAERIHFRIFREVSSLGGEPDGSACGRLVFRIARTEPDSSGAFEDEFHFQNLETSYGHHHNTYREHR